MSDEYYNEQEQWERVKKWLRENGPWLLAGVVLGLAALAAVAEDGVKHFGGPSPFSLRREASLSYRSFRWQAICILGREIGRAHV